MAEHRLHFIPYQLNKLIRTILSACYPKAGYGPVKETGRQSLRLIPGICVS